MGLGRQADDVFVGVNYEGLVKETVVVRVGGFNRVLEVS